MRVAWTPPLPGGSWPEIRGGKRLSMPDVATTPAVTASPRWRFALRDDAYVDHRLRLLTGGPVQAHLHVDPVPPVRRRARRAAAGTGQEMEQTLDAGDISRELGTSAVGLVLPDAVAKKQDLALPCAGTLGHGTVSDLASLVDPARMFAAQIPGATDSELDLGPERDEEWDEEVADELAEKLKHGPGVQRELVRHESACPCGRSGAGGGRVRERVVFSDSRGRVLLFSTFWWDARLYAWLDARRDVDGGPTVVPSLLGRLRYEHSRRMLGVVYGMPGPVARPTWGREYVFKRRGCPVLVAQEVFAEGICRYLGPVTPPLFKSDGQ